MKRDRSSEKRTMTDATPESTAVRVLQISEISRAISRICESELLHTMTYSCKGDGVVEISIPAMGHGLSLFLKGIGRRDVLELEAFVEDGNYTIVCRSGKGLPTRRELAEMSIYMRRAGFDVFLHGEVVILQTKLRNPTVLTLYAESGLDIELLLSLELQDYVNNYLLSDE